MAQRICQLLCRARFCCGDGLLVKRYVIACLESFEICSQFGLCLGTAAQLHQLIVREQESAAGCAEATAQIGKNAVSLGAPEGGCGNKLPKNGTIATALENIAAIGEDDQSHAVNKHLSPTEELANVVCREEEHSAANAREEAELTLNAVNHYAVRVCRESILLAAVGKVERECAIIGNTREGNARGNGCHRQPKDAVFLKRLCLGIVDGIGNAFAVNDGVVTRFGEHSCALELGHSCKNGSDAILVNVKAINIKNGRASLGGHVQCLEDDAADIVPAIAFSRTVQKRDLKAIVVPAVLCNGNDGLIAAYIFARLAIAEHQTEGCACRCNGTIRKGQIAHARKIGATHRNHNTVKIAQSPSRAHMCALFVRKVRLHSRAFNQIVLVHINQNLCRALPPGFDHTSQILFHLSFLFFMYFSNYFTV